MNEVLLGRAGIYLLADSALEGSWPGDKIIYIGSAGGRGQGSTFHDRVHKHALKAMNVTADEVKGSGITDTRRWRQYRDTKSPHHSPLDTWLVRLILFPNATEGERAAILFAEDAIVLAFDRRHHVGTRMVAMPRCNSQSLGERLLAVVDTVLEEPLAVAAPDVHVAPIEEAAAPGMPPEVVHEPADLDALDDLLFDEEFDQKLGTMLSALYPPLLEQLAAVCSTEQAQAVGLQVYYTNKKGRELRVGWQYSQPFEVLLCIGKVGDRFDSYTRAPADRLPPHLHVDEIEHAKFRQYRAGGDDFVANAAALLSAILAWAVDQRGG